MQIDDIKNPSLKKLFEEVRHHSSTIVADAEDALEESSNDEELISNWQSSLESLHHETQHFWGSLENIKLHPPIPKQELALQWYDEYVKDKGSGWSPDLFDTKIRTRDEYSAVFDRLVKEGYKVYAELENGRYHIYMKRRQ